MWTNEFKNNGSDTHFYIKDTLNHKVTICLYVDDMIIIRKDTNEINT